MAERRGSQRQNGRADLGVGDDLDAEDIGEARAAVIAEGAEDEVFAFLVEDKNTGEHGEERGEGAGGGRREEGREEKERERKGGRGWNGDPTRSCLRVGKAEVTTECSGVSVEKIRLARVAIIVLTTITNITLILSHTIHRLLRLSHIRFQIYPQHIRPRPIFIDRQQSGTAR